MSRAPRGAYILLVTTPRHGFAGCRVRCFQGFGRLVK